MKGFYIGLGALAVGGAGVLFLVGGGAAAVPTGPIDMAAIAAARDWDGYVVGDADAPVEIIEYADFECPACRVWWVLNTQDVKRRLVASGRVRFSFRDFPLHQNSVQAHHAAACADEQGMFEQMHDKLFDTQQEWTGRAGVESRFYGYAQEIGIDLARYDDCMGEGRYRARIQASREDGAGMGVISTPTLFVGGTKYDRGLNYDQIKAIVDSLAPVDSQ
ncbi:MAG: DsbA family protein [Gemmatimonadetes bacterium]|nr:DsbA family protein [Gemmatimonadota bacterium]